MDYVFLAIGAALLGVGLPTSMAFWERVAVLCGVLLIAFGTTLGRL